MYFAYQFGEDLSDRCQFVVYPLLVIASDHDQAMNIFHGICRNPVLVPFRGELAAIFRPWISQTFRANEHSLFEEIIADILLNSQLRVFVRMLENLQVQSRQGRKHELDSILSW